jgi:hypothetical protein
LHGLAAAGPLRADADARDRQGREKGQNNDALCLDQAGSPSLTTFTVSGTVTSRWSFKGT